MKLPLIFVNNRKTTDAVSVFNMFETYTGSFKKCSINLRQGKNLKLADSCFKNSLSLQLDAISWLD